MFTAERLRDLLRAQPFKPFRLCMTDGKPYDIPHTENAFVLSHAVEVGVNLNAKGIVTRSHHCAYIHITRIEDIPALAA